MKRTPLKRKTPLRASAEKAIKVTWSRLKPVSKKRSAQLREYAKKRKAFLEKRDFCDLCVIKHAGDEHPINRATEVHHRAKRRQDMLNDERFWMALCRPCHRYLEDNKGWARERAYLLNF